jgi:5-methylthioadenosine/S-adenosylhomocysteine deaminase
VADETLKRIAVLAEELDVPIHTHVHETRARSSRALAQHGVRPLERLRRLGIVEPRLIAAHASTSSPRSSISSRARGVRIAHCPSSNLKLASGIAPVAAMQARGISWRWAPMARRATTAST